MRPAPGIAASFLLSLVLACGLGSVLAVSGSKLPPNQLVRFSGTLRDAGGQPLTGEHVLVFEIFDGARGGEPVWKEKHRATLEDGVYTVLLGSVSRLSVPVDRDYYLFVHPEGLDESLEEYRIVVAVQSPPGEPGTLPGERGVYRFEVSGKKGGKGKPVADRKAAGAIDASPDVNAEPVGEDEVSEDATLSAKGLKLRTVKQIQSPNGTLTAFPVTGTPDPFVLPGTGLLSLDVNIATVQQRVAGRLIDVFVANAGGPNNTPGFVPVHSDYTPPVNATAMVFMRCSYDGNAAGQSVFFRNAIRSPSGTGGVTIGDSFYLYAHTPGANLSVFGVNYDFFTLVGGTSYDFGVNFFSPTPNLGSNFDYCSAMIQIFSR